MGEQHLRFGPRQLRDPATELLVDEESLAARAGLNPHDRVLGSQRASRVVVGAGEALEHRLQGIAERVVDIEGVDPHGVAAELGTLDHVQQRRDRGRLREGDVGVPEVGLGGDLGIELDDLGELLVDIRDVGVHLELTEEGTDVAKLLDGGSKTGEEEHQMRGEGIHQLSGGRLVEPVGRQAAHRGAE